MSKVTASNSMSRFLSFLNYQHKAQAQVVQSLTPPSKPNENINNNNNKYHVNEIVAIAVADQLADQLKNLAFAAAIAIASEVNVMSTTTTTNTTLKSNHGLKRTISSLHNRVPSTSHSSCCSSLASSIESKSSEKTVCTDSNHQNCIVEAKQIEIEIVNLSKKTFELVIQAPNNECSPKFSFKDYGKTELFLPFQPGCGHGIWKFEMTETILVNNKKTTKKSTETIYLDGVGSLFFSIDENLHIRLLSQEFLRLPFASQFCNQNRLATTKSLKCK